MKPRSRLLAAAFLLVTACGGNDGDTAESGGPVQGEILVSAAGSLTDAFAGIEEAFEVAHPGTDVILNLAASSALREQILQGAPADVFASANTANMDQVVDGGDTVGDPIVFVHNLLQIAVPAGNPAGIAGLGDFAREELVIGLCAEGVPCGDFARESLALAGVDPAVDTDEPNVRALLTKIELGEVDAGITYVTDVASAGGTVDGVDIPAAVNVVADYPIAVLKNAPNPDGAEAFVAFVVSESGREIMAGFGFALP